MGRIGRVISSFIQKIPGSSVLAQFSNIEEFAGDERTYQSYGPCNEDFAPPENVKTLNKNIGREAGFIVSHAYKNESIPPVAIHGEFRKYSTNQAGDTVMAEIFFKQDGTMLVDNGAVTITAHPSGLLEIETSGNSEITSAKTIINNDVDIIGNVDITGNLTVSGFITAIGNITGAIVTGLINVVFGPSSKSSNTHTHTDSTSGPDNTGGPA